MKNSDAAVGNRTTMSDRVGVSPAATRRLRVAALLIASGYVLLCASLLFRHAVALTVSIPAGAGLIAIGVVLWMSVVVADARSKGMV